MEQHFENRNKKKAMFNMELQQDVRHPMVPITKHLSSPYGKEDRQLHIVHNAHCAACDFPLGHQLLYVLIYLGYFFFKCGRLPVRGDEGKEE